VEYDEASPLYRALREHLEFPDGRTRDNGVRFYVLTLAEAEKNRAHDEPGFWKNWSEQLLATPFCPELVQQDTPAEVPDAVAYMSDEQLQANLERFARELRQ
jgi:hypothetical protein